VCQPRYGAQLLAVQHLRLRPGLRADEAGQRLLAGRATRQVHAVKQDGQILVVGIGQVAMVDERRGLRVAADEAQGAAR
jgi:hypothetical protein